jgi:2-polyprenyl-6-hydroxyphenyl methylase/3-demethylubiquinone-9 3-methyltransferase
MTRIVDPEEREVEVLRRLVTFRGKRVLDVGCGDGRTARHIARSAASVIGVDPDPERISLAREAAGRDQPCDLKFLTEDAVTLDLPAAKFDVVIFTRSL